MKEDVLFLVPFFPWFKERFYSAADGKEKEGQRKRDTDPYFTKFIANYNTFTIVSIFYQFSCVSTVKIKQFFFNNRCNIQLIYFSVSESSGMPFNVAITVVLQFL